MEIVHPDTVSHVHKQIRVFQHGRRHGHDSWAVDPSDNSEVTDAQGF